MNTPNPYILPFSNITANDIALVGGKGANLGEMINAGFPIPDGLCLTTQAFQLFMDSSGKTAEVFQLLDTVHTDDVDSVRSVGAKVRGLLEEAAMPREVADAFKAAWQEMGVEQAYSVRSSATAEDLPSASFAGQQDTYLNVQGEQALLAAIKRCWISLFTDRAIVYRNQNQFTHQEVKLSVVVQTMVQSTVSGIAFTADPIEGRRNIVTIDASFGLGEALVSGLVNPDAYKFDKTTNTIVGKTIAKKQMAIVSKQDGGTEEHTIASDKQEQAVLTDEQITQLGSLCEKIEQHYGVPQDIEWGIANNELYILQSRPITSLYPIEELITDDKFQIFFCSGHQQMMTGTLAPIAASTMRMVLPIGKPHNAIETNIMQLAGGRLYVDLAPLLKHPLFKRVVFNVLSQFSTLGVQALRKSMDEPGFKNVRRVRLPLQYVPKAFGIFLQVIRAVFFQKLDGFISQTNSRIASSLHTVEEELKSKQNGVEQTQHIVNTVSGFGSLIIEWIPQFAAAEMAKRIVQKVVGKQASAEDIDAITLGLDGNVVTEMNLAVGDLADTARSSDALVNALHDLGSDSDAWMQQAKRLEGSEPFFTQLAEFMDTYGSRGASEIDMMQLRWYEEPMPLLQTIAANLQTPPRSHLQQHDKLVAKRMEAAKRIVETTSGVFGWLKRPLVKRLLYVVESAGGLREHHKFLLIRMMRIAKENLKQQAFALVKEDKLNNEDDIWFLTWPEVLDIHSSDKDYKVIIQERKSNYKHYADLTPPVVITSDGYTPQVTHDVGNVPDGALVGSPVSSGVIEGTIRVITNPQTEQLQPGEILVASFTDPGWTPLFINAAGLILEIGGLMTHGSVVAREYGIPAVVGVQDALSQLNTGDRVRVDGNRGVIEMV